MQPRGWEWLIEAHGCEAEELSNPAALRALFARLIAGLHLHPIGEASWHQFPVTGGITGLCLLTESHLACHTFPEFRSLCLNLFCCREREDWGFEADLKERFGAQRVTIRKVERPYS